MGRYTLCTSQFNAFEIESKGDNSWNNTWSVDLPQKLCQNLLQKVDNVVWQIEQGVRLLQNLMIEDDPSYW